MEGSTYFFLTLAILARRQREARTRTPRAPKATALIVAVAVPAPLASCAKLCWNRRCRRPARTSSFPGCFRKAERLRTKRKNTNSHPQAFLILDLSSNLVIDPGRAEKERRPHPLLSASAGTGESAGRRHARNHNRDPASSLSRR